MEIEYAVLADHAEVTNNKLYLMGGGWDAMGAVEAPANVRLTLATGVRVEWHEANATIPLHVRLDDEDAQEILRVEGEMNVSTPQDAGAGTSHLSQMVFALNVALPRFGGYRLTVSAGPADAQLRRSLPFRLVKV